MIFSRVLLHASTSVGVRAGVGDSQLESLPWRYGTVEIR